VSCRRWRKWSCFSNNSLEFFIKCVVTAALLDLQRFNTPDLIKLKKHYNFIVRVILNSGSFYVFLDLIKNFF